MLHLQGDQTATTKTFWLGDQLLLLMWYLASGDTWLLQMLKPRNDYAYTFAPADLKLL